MRVVHNRLRGGSVIESVGEGKASVGEPMGEDGLLWEHFSVKNYFV